MFREVPSDIDFPAAEREVQRMWAERDIPRRAYEQRRDAPTFVFFEGPPTANGLPHPGHCLTRAIKDVFPRYRTMRGQRCLRRGGWDTHGLPVEVEVCKELGIHSKEEIESFGVEPFVKRCQQSVFRYVQEWEQLTERLGFWVDLESAYVTYHQSYVESIWWALKTFFDAGLLYQGHKIVWWWPQGGTALSAAEVGQGYREVDDPSVYVRFPLVDENAALLVWTTTPWTLPSNTFCAVHPELEYARVEDRESGEQLYIAAELVEDIARRARREFEVLDKRLGARLVGRRYRPPFDFYSRDLAERTASLAEGGEAAIAWRVLAADFVTLDAGTGLVHQAPAFGDVDFELLQAERRRFAEPESIPLLCAVAPDGCFTAEAGSYAGRWVKDADRDIVRELRERRLLFHQEQVRHDYPFCWRAQEDPLIQYPRRSWFLRTTEFVDQMLANNEQIHWYPEHIRDGRFGKFLATNVDWTLSRERYWGTPLPIWVCEKTGHAEAIASYDELLAKPGVAGTEVWERARQETPNLCEDLKVHRPYIDAVTYTSPRDPSARMRRVPEVIDCWFDSGAMPFAQWGYPHHNREQFLEQFPADFISEALDQTRGWFYSLLAISTLLFGERGVARTHGGIDDLPPPVWPLPYRNCVVLGLLKGEDGLKMSKSKQNYRTPDYIFEHQGADAMRWNFFAGNPPWTSTLFQDRAISEAQREYLIRLYNVYSFFVIYANIDGWQPSGDFRRAPELGDGAAELDRWLIGELHATVANLCERLDAFDSFGAARILSEFVDGLSNWYVRRSRQRFWRSGMDADKESAYATLYHALATVALASAPFTPYFAETLYQNLVRSRDDEVGSAAPESVHLCDYPECDASRLDEELARAVRGVREIVSLGRAVRAQNQLKVRLPLSLAEVVVADGQRLDALSPMTPLIAEELNVKRVEFTTDADQYVHYRVKPNFRALGPRLGPRMKAVQQALAGHPDPAALRAQLNDAGRATLDVEGESVELSADEIEVDLVARDGWAAAQGRGAVVVLKTEVTEELRREGLAREFVHAVQNVRKELDLAYECRISLSVEAPGELAAVLDEFSSWIAGETLARSFSTTLSETGEIPPREAKIEGHAVRIAVQPLALE